MHGGAVPQATPNLNRSPKALKNIGNKIISQNKRPQTPAAFSLPIASVHHWACASIVRRALREGLGRRGFLGRAGRFGAIAFV